MRKPESLKNLLIATVPALAQNKERLTLFIDNGRIAGGNGRSLSFEYQYRVNVVVEDFTGSLDDIIVPVLAWIAEHQPELIGKPNAAPFSFEAEILDADSQDVSIVIELTEAVLVAAQAGGGFTVRHPVPPPTAQLDRFEGVASGTKLWQVFLDDALMIQTADPEVEP